MIKKKETIFDKNERDKRTFFTEFLRNMIGNYGITKLAGVADLLGVTDDLNIPKEWLIATKLLQKGIDDLRTNVELSLEHSLYKLKEVEKE